MKLKQTTLFKRELTPWYDADAVCVILIIAASGIFLFAAAGIKVAAACPMYLDYLWFPCTLAALSLFIAGKVVVRLAGRNRNQSDF
ncbi:MAG: hypothetical protein U9P10_00130 [Thermodesulfobacteriota bacterium]|nr:hypothetical protein [Thermodesulfobacteriota bacterium]